MVALILASERQNCECCLTVVRDGSIASGAVFDGRGQIAHLSEFFWTHIMQEDKCNFLLLDTRPMWHLRLSLLVGIPPVN
eukprot:scaffold127852_cov24-Cyclotella_meneghiniana.AAC.1